jgi:hypothetical protein
MTDLSPEAQELLRHARKAFSPSESRLQAVRSALRAEIAASPAPISSASSSGGLGVPSLGAAGWSTGHGVLAAVAIGAIGAGALTLWVSAPRTSSTPAANTEALVHPSPAIAPMAEQAEEHGEPIAPPAADPWPSQASPAAPAASPRDRTSEQRAPFVAPGSARARAKSESLALPPAATAVTDSLAEEVRMLHAARSALDRGEAAHALRLLDAHRARFRHGTLQEERLATRVQALCALGLVERARAAAQELERVAPRSPHLARARTSCISGPPNR